MTPAPDDEIARAMARNLKKWQDSSIAQDGNASPGDLLTLAAQDTLWEQTERLQLWADSGVSPAYVLRMARTLLAFCRDSGVDA